jgi:hypothetical protein
MTVKNVDCKQEPIENPFSFQWGLFLQMLVGEHRAIFGKLRLGSWSEIHFSKIDASIRLYIWKLFTLVNPFWNWIQTEKQ